MFSVYFLKSNFFGPSDQKSIDIEILSIIESKKLIVYSMKRYTHLIYVVIYIFVMNGMIELNKKITSATYTNCCPIVCSIDR